MKLKYEVAFLMQVISYNPSAEYIGDPKTNIIQDLSNYLVLGWEIYQAIPVGNNSLLAIQYIVRRPIVT